MTFLSMELLLIIVYTTLIKFCRDVKKLILFLIGRNATTWLIKGLSLGIKFLKEVYKLIELRLRQLRRCHAQETSKVFVVSLVMLVSIEGLLKTFLGYQKPSLIFFKKMYLSFLMMIVRKLLKLLRRI